MPNGSAPSSTAKVEVHLDKEAPAKHDADSTSQQLPPRFIPKEGYELIGALIKVDPILTKYLLKLLKGTELVPDEDSPSGYTEREIKGTHPFCNNDGTDKIIDLVMIHINTPLTYRESNKFNPQPPSQISGSISKQFIKDVAANYERWEVQNPSLIPQISAILFNYIKAAQGQQTELPEGLLSGGALHPKNEQQMEARKSKGRISL